MSYRLVKQVGCSRGRDLGTGMRAIGALRFGNDGAFPCAECGQSVAFHTFSPAPSGRSCSRLAPPTRLVLFMERKIARAAIGEWGQTTMRAIRGPSTMQREADGPYLSAV